MKRILGIILLTASINAFADSVTTVTTQTSQSNASAVPITIDSTKRTYIVTGTPPTTTTEYYYTYPGYHCYTVKKQIVGSDAVVYNAPTGGSEIYCYPAQ